MAKGNGNLIVPTSEQARINGSKGGKERARRRKERILLKESLLLMLEEGNMQDNITLALLQKALSGDTKAYEVIRDTIGEKPVDKVEMDTAVEIVVDIED